MPLGYFNPAFRFKFTDEESVKLSTAIGFIKLNAVSRWQKLIHHPNTFSIAKMKQPQNGYAGGKLKRLRFCFK